MSEHNLQLGFLSLFEKLTKSNTNVLITLKNNTQIEGCVKFVDKAFNFFIENATLKNKDQNRKYKTLLIRGSSIKKMSLKKQQLNPIIV